MSINNYLTVEALDASMEIVDVTLSTREVFAELAVDALIGNVLFGLSALNTSGTGNGWVLSAAMAPGDTLNLTTLINSLLNKLLQSAFSLPTSFPTVVCMGAQVRITPATGAFWIDLTSTITWPVPFANSQFQIQNLHPTLDIGAIPPPPDTQRSYTFQVSGAFSFANIHGDASFITSNVTGDLVNRRRSKLDPISATIMAGAYNLPGDRR